MSPTMGPKAVQILDGAGSAFVELGYEGASMDEIARRARVSKPTLYSYFHDKRSVFAAFVTRECEEKGNDVFDFDTTTHGIELKLHTIGNRFLNIILTPFAQGIYRLVVGEAQRFPEVGRIFYSAIELTNQRMTHILASAVGRGELKINDIEFAARQFLDLCQVQMVDRRLFDPDAPTSAALCKRVVDSAVMVFMRAYGP